MRFHVVNAGINGNLAWNVLQGLNDVIACKPDVVTLLAGTNDWKDIQNEKWAKTSQSFMKNPQSATEEWFVDNMRAIIRRLLDELENVHIGVCQVPIMGEDPASQANRYVHRANGLLKDLVAEFSGRAARRIEIIPIADSLFAYLRDVPANLSGQAPMPFEKWEAMMAPTSIRHYLCRTSWDQLGERLGLRLSCDGLHLNDTGAKIVANQLASFVCQCCSNTKW
eukprot:gnl/MRDRNA2_/MRDRNA2_59779_c0_seq2.p1 gnl/MRDRNA2_/MRDRNA2_59779_c0~~gnl/MRDRNA2_/MRDRNA2_59779_c0_seq2.p1  ORF type:complete len:224 (+),score=33.03 gnl/MRDRNA2_/MRDRNA2_59779_c0_seq2:487-1158(+)